ncbi:MAG: phosphatase PAP2 family protein [Prevotellaceae bacterium]|nr:phosphatase PAP2 family protein [Prevotellaceae bacterium]MDO4932439.1 phosphatase PAP2 family protein [Prevotellaceae bacterium]
MDTQLFFLVNGHHTLFLDEFFYLVSQKAVWVPLYVSLLYVVWRNYSWRGVLTVLLMVGAGMIVTDWANAHLLRPYIGRLRPSNPDNPIAHLVHVVHGRHGGGCGFPSAHSANIWLLTLLMIHWFRDGLLSLVMVLTAVLVCYSRVYLGFHYPGDILGGFVLALIVTWLITWVHEDHLHFHHVRSPRHIWVPAAVVSLTLTAFALMAWASL